MRKRKKNFISPQGQNEVPKEVYEETLRSIMTGNEIYPKVTYNKCDGKLFIEINKLWNELAFNSNLKLQAELQEVMTIYYYVKNKKPKLFSRIKTELLVIDLYEKYYRLDTSQVSKSKDEKNKQDKAIEKVYDILIGMSIGLSIEGIRTILKRYRKEKLKNKF